MKRMGIEGIYLGRLGDVAKDSVTERPRTRPGQLSAFAGAGEAAPIVPRPAHGGPEPALRPLADERAGRSVPRPGDRLPALHQWDADTGHGGDVHVRNLVRRP